MEHQLEQVKAKGLDMAEWQRLYNRHQQEYKRKRLRAIKAAKEHSSLRGLARVLACSTNTLASWFSTYLEQGLRGLVADIHRQRGERLSSEQKQQVAQWLEEKQPVDFGLEQAYIWTAERIAAVVKQEFGVHYQPMGIYKLLYRMGYSHQRAHRDYGNASREEQQAFVAAFKKKFWS
jgi:transposase